MHDVVVVGAGIAGLAASRLLASKGLDVVVIEARHRAGGRLFAKRSRDLGTRVELGGEFVGEHHRYTRALCDSLRVGLARRPRSLSQTAVPDRILAQGEVVGDSEVSACRSDVEEVIDDLVELAGDIKDHITIPSGLLSDLDQVTVTDWLRKRRTPTLAASLFSDLPPGSQSLLSLLALVQAAGGRLFFEGVERFSFVRGTGELIGALTKSVSPIRYGVIAKSIKQKLGHMELGVQSQDNVRGQIQARAIVVTVPPPCWRSIDGLQRWANLWSPPFCANQKLVILFRPDRKARFNRECVALSDGPCRLAWLTPVECGRLVRIDVLVCPYLARRPPTKADLCRMALEVCGVRHTGDLRSYLMRWDESRWSRGAYPVLNKGAFARLHRFREWNSEMLAFAGDSLIPGFAGYIEGAVRSAYGASERILDGFH